MWENGQNENAKNEADLSRWGLSLEAIASLGERLQHFWRYYGQWTRTQTRNTSAYGLAYLRSHLKII